MVFSQGCFLEGSYPIPEKRKTQSEVYRSIQNPREDQTCSVSLGVTPRVEPDPFHILEVTLVELEEDLPFEIQPVPIMDQEMKQLRSKVIPMVKVLQMSDMIEGTTWEPEASMRNHYPYLFEVQHVEILRTKFL